MQRSTFPVYDALYREAITSGSPYYRLRLGFIREFVDRVRTANDLVGQLTEMRDAITIFYRNGCRRVSGLLS